MTNVYDLNAPQDDPGPQAQPEMKREKTEQREGNTPLPQLKETVERWKKEILDKIQYLRANLDQALQDKEALALEADQLKGQLTAAQSRIQQLEVDLAGVLDLYNSLIQEVNGALQD